MNRCPNAWGLRMECIVSLMKGDTHQIVFTHLNLSGPLTTGSKRRSSASSVKSLSFSASNTSYNSII